jgi:hypothetical protein
LVPLGALALLGQMPPGGGAPAQAHLELRTPDWTARVEWIGPDGEPRQLGETGLIREPIAVPAGPARICLHNPVFQPRCLDVQLLDGETLRWEVWLEELEPALVRVMLPDRVVSARRRVAGVRDASAVAVDGWITVPALHDTWLELLDADGQRCLCHVPRPTRDEPYVCPWECPET